MLQYRKITDTQVTELLYLPPRVELISAKTTKSTFFELALPHTLLSHAIPKQYYNNTKISPSGLKMRSLDKPITEPDYTIRTFPLPHIGADGTLCLAGVTAAVGKAKNLVEAYNIIIQGTNKYFLDYPHELTSKVTYGFKELLTIWEKKYTIDNINEAKIFKPIKTASYDISTFEKIEIEESLALAAE